MPIILAQATPPPAADAPAPATTNVGITPPAWVRKPTGEDIARVYPERAVRAGHNGDVLMKCQVTAEGMLADCAIVSEAPAGDHFGDAALKLSRLFRMRPMVKDGAPVVGGSISIPIHFRVSR
jgi:protein TonB